LFLLIAFSFLGSEAIAMPVEKEGADADDEWSEAWAAYKRDCAAEEAEARARGITDEDVANQTSPPDEPRPVEKLTPEKISKIKNMMAGIKLKPPMWALK
jgi:hypothetical protein